MCVGAENASERQGHYPFDLRIEYEVRTVMSAVFVCLLNHANHDLSSQTARRTRLSILSGSLITSLFDIVEQP